MDGELTPGVRDGVGIRTELKKQVERGKKNRLTYGQQDCLQMKPRFWNGPSRAAGGTAGMANQCEI